MARIIHQGAVYHEISLKMFHESEVQSALASRARIIFPGYVYVHYAGLIQSDADSARPDFVLIEDGYRAWYVGEVEMVRHDLVGHVLRQVRVFGKGDYEEEHAKSITSRSPELDENRVRLLIETLPPTVLVVTDKKDETWVNTLHSEGARVAVVEMFRREDSSDLIFSVDGDTPEIPGEVLSYCEFDHSLPRLLKVHRPSGIPAYNGERLTVEYEGVLSEWVFVVADDKAWLNPIGYPDIPNDVRYSLNLSPDGKLKLEAK